mmetsp:Transcript_18718/g.46126  ORF Transcript_18718/g.46126 Transcript_18718/m.46126 type:complete len:89 (+) Transcript_18718:972-1238(+)
MTRGRRGAHHAPPLMAHGSAAPSSLTRRSRVAVRCSRRRAMTTVRASAHALGIGLAAARVTAVVPRAGLVGATASAAAGAALYRQNIF